MLGSIARAKRDGGDMIHLGLLSSNAYGNPASWFPRFVVGYDFFHLGLSIKVCIKKREYSSQKVGGIRYISR